MFVVLRLVIVGWLGQWEQDSIEIARVPRSVDCASALDVYRIHVAEWHEMSIVECQI